MIAFRTVKVKLLFIILRVVHSLSIIALDVYIIGYMIDVR